MGDLRLENNTSLSLFFFQPQYYKNKWDNWNIITEIKKDG